MAQTTKPRRAPATDHGGASEGEGTKRPVHEERIGRICGAVWPHTDGTGQVWYNVTFSRIYKDQGGQRARSDSFGRNDLPLLRKVADRCHDWLFSKSGDTGDD
jgi:hypothetical protein